jgi:sugar transferase (PEP-CTERM/EpsH1 system associated)
MSSPPLIAHIVNRFDYGGLENGVANLVNGLPPGFCRHAIVTLSGYTAFSGRITRDVEFFSIEKRPGKDFGAYARLWRLLRRLAPAVVHTRNIGTLDCSIVAASAGVPVRIHGMHGWDVGDLHGENAKYRALYRVCNIAIQRYVTVSRNLGEWLERAVRVQPTKIRQIYNGVDTDRFRPLAAGPNVLPPELAPGAGRIIFASVGRIAAVKNHELLVRAFAALVRQQPRGRERLRLAIVGDGPLRERIMELARELRVDALCWFPGARDDVAAILAAIDVFVLPSLNEGISNTVLEAMAAARPVVATYVGGNPELVEHEKTGYLVPSEDPDALAAALGRYCDAGGGLIREHGDAGRRRVRERFSLSRMIEDYRRLYEEALVAAA